MALTQRVREHLINTGVITARGLTRHATYRHCPRGCGLLLIASQDLGHETWCDPWPITPKGELDAHLSGTRTWTLILGQLCWRDADRITFRDANTDQVFAEHQCGKPQPEINYAHIQKRQRPDYTQEPPF